MYIIHPSQHTGEAAYRQSDILQNNSISIHEARNYSLVWDTQRCRCDHHHTASNCVSHMMRFINHDPDPAAKHNSQHQAWNMQITHQNICRVHSHALVWLQPSQEQWHGLLQMCVLLNFLANVGLWGKLLLFLRSVDGDHIWKGCHWPLFALGIPVEHDLDFDTQHSL